MHFRVELSGKDELGQRLDTGLDLDRIPGIISVHMLSPSPTHPVSKDEMTSKSSWQKLPPSLAPSAWAHRARAERRRGDGGTGKAAYVQLGHRRHVAESQRCVSNSGLD